MPTGLQLAILAGGLVGLGVALIVWRLTPADPDLGDALNRLSPNRTRSRRGSRHGRRQAPATRGNGSGCGG